MVSNRIIVVDARHTTMIRTILRVRDMIMRLWGLEAGNGRLRGGRCGKLRGGIQS